MPIVLLTLSHLTGHKSEARPLLALGGSFSLLPQASLLGFPVNPESLRQRLGPGMVWLFLPMEPPVSIFSLGSVRAKGCPEMVVMAFLVPNFDGKYSWVLRVP